MSHDDALDGDLAPPRDLAWEALNDAMGAARVSGEYTLYLMLERVLEARESGTLGRWVVEMEQAGDVLRRSNTPIA